MATRITDNDMNSINTFGDDGETSHLAQRWKTWKKAFWLYVVRKMRYAGCTKEGIVAPYSRIGGATNLLHLSRRI